MGSWRIINKHVLFKFYFIYLSSLGLSYSKWDLRSLLRHAGFFRFHLQQVRSSSLTRDQTWDLCTGNTESQLLDTREVLNKHFLLLILSLILDLQLWIIFSQFLFFFFASMEHMVMNIYITISWQLFQMRYFPCLTIYTNIQASSWGRFYDLLLKYTTITLVILLVCHTCPPLGWLPMLIDIQTTQNFCSIGFSMKNTTAWWTVLKCHGTTSMKLWATINTSIKPPAIMCWGDAEKLACFWECWQWQSVGNNSISGPSWESWVLGTGISEL